MKKIILRIIGAIGIIGFIGCMFLYKYVYDILDNIQIRFTDTLFFNMADVMDIYITLLSFFALLSILGFTQVVAKIKAAFDFFFPYIDDNFDDDPDMDDYPKLRIGYYIRNTITVLISSVYPICRIINIFNPFLTSALDTKIIISLCSAVALIFLVFVIIRLCMKIKRSPFDYAVISLCIFFGLTAFLTFKNYSTRTIIFSTAPFLILSFVYFFLCWEDCDIFLIDIFDDEYFDFYYKLIDIEKKIKEKKGKKEKLEKLERKDNLISNRKNAKHKKIDTKKTVKKDKKDKKTQKKTAKKEEKVQKKANKYAASKSKSSSTKKKNSSFETK